MFNQLTNAFPTFRFIVTVNGTHYGVFTECSLPAIDWDYTTVKEGGLNTHVHTLIGRRKETRFTLKNGVGTGLLVSWYMLTMAGEFTTTGMALRRTVTILLLNSLKIPVMTWNISDAFPLKWTGPQLNTGENSVAIQTLEFSGGEVTIIPGAVGL